MDVDVRVDPGSAAALQAQLLAVRDKVSSGQQKAGDEAAAETVREVQRRSPRLTGRYAAAWQVVSGPSAPGTSSRSVQNPSPQANRLERGFVGVDSLGRHYAQPPFPHIEPALDAVGPKYEQAMQQVVDGAL